MVQRDAARCHAGQYSSPCLQATRIPRRPLPQPSPPRGHAAGWGSRRTGPCHLVTRLTPVTAPRPLCGQPLPSPGETPLTFPATLAGERTVVIGKTYTRTGTLGGYTTGGCGHHNPPPRTRRRSRLLLGPCLPPIHSTPTLRSRYGHSRVHAVATAGVRIHEASYPVLREHQSHAHATSLTPHACYIHKHITPHSQQA